MAETAGPALPIAGAAVVDTVLEQLEALPDPQMPTGIVRSKYMKKFLLLDKMDVRRLEIDKKKNNVTHVCSFCNICFNISWRKYIVIGLEGKGAYDTTKVLRHLKSECTGGGKDCPEILELVAKEIAGKKRKTEQLSKHLKDYHAAEGQRLEQSPEGRKKVKKQSDIRGLDTQSYHDRALCAQAHFFLYSKSSIPVSMFDDPLFKEMLKAMIPPTCQVDKPPLLNNFGALQYTTSEFELFKSCLNKELEPMVLESKGNAFCQIIHDGVTLSNKSKYQAFGIQFTNRKFHCNHVVALGFQKVKNSTGDTVSNLGKELVKDRTNFDFKQITACAVQDSAAKSVARAWELEVETCDMHDGDKIGASAIGRLVRKDGRGGIVNSFPEGQALEVKLNAQAKHFSAVHKNRQRYQDIIGSSNEDQNLPTTMIKQDLCGTRMSSFHGLVRSTLKVKKSLDLYFLTRRNEQGSTVTDFLSTEDWKFALEVEAILNISKDLVTISQTESKLNAAYGPVLRNVTYKKFINDNMMVIDITNWGSTSRSPRKELNVNDFTESGRRCRERATLECERRFFGHNGEETMDAEGAVAKMKLSKREMATLHLDKRTCLQTSILSTKKEWTEGKNELQSFYIEFYKKRKQYDREKSRGGVNPIRANIVELPPSSNIIDMDSDDCDSDLDNSDIADEDENLAEIDEAAQAQIDALEAKQEFKRVIKKWYKWTPDWKKLFPEKKFPSRTNEAGVEICEPDPFEDLIDIDMTHLMQHIEQHNSDNANVFGYLPLMCRLSPCQLGALNAQSFVERMNSCAKLVMGEKRTRLRHDLIDKLVVLRMNRNFVDYCRKKGSIAKVASVVNERQNDETIFE